MTGKSVPPGSRSAVVPALEVLSKLMFAHDGVLFRRFRKSAGVSGNLKLVVGMLYGATVSSRQIAPLRPSGGRGRGPGASAPGRVRWVASQTTSDRPPSPFPLPLAGGGRGLIWRRDKPSSFRGQPCEEAGTQELNALALGPAFAGDDLRVRAIGLLSFFAGQTNRSAANSLGDPITPAGE